MQAAILTANGPSQVQGILLLSVSEKAVGGMTKLIERKTTIPAGLQTAGGVMTQIIERSAIPDDEASIQISMPRSVWRNVLLLER